MRLLRAGRAWLAAAAAAAAATGGAALYSSKLAGASPTKTHLLPPRRHIATAATTTTPTSPWVILGSIPRVALGSGGADMSLALTAPPHVSRLTVSGRVFPVRITPQSFPFVLATDRSGLLLLSAILATPWRRVVIDRPDHQSFRWDDTDPRYYVLDATTGAAFRLPDPAPQETILHQALVGLLPCSGGGFMVAELVPLIGSDTASLRCYSSDVGKWVHKRVHYPLPPRLLAPNCTLAHHGRLWWADYSWGIITADPFAEAPVLRLVPLPRQCVLQCGEGLGVLEKFRYVGVSAGKLRFVDTYRGAPTKVTVWTLNDPDATEWTVEHEATFADIWADESYKATGLPKKPPCWRSSTPTTPPSSTSSWRTTSSPSTFPPARSSTATATIWWRLPATTSSPTDSSGLGSYRHRSPQIRGIGRLTSARLGTEAPP